MPTDADMPRRPTPEETAGAGAARGTTAETRTTESVPGLCGGRGQNVRDAERGQPAAAARAGCGDRLHRNPQAQGNRGADRRSGDRSAQADRVPGNTLSRKWTRKPSSRAIRNGRSWTNWRTPTCPARLAPSAGRTWKLLLDAGINVLSAMNVQHLESLNDTVHDITGHPGARNRSRPYHARRRRSEDGGHHAPRADSPSGARRHLQAPDKVQQALATGSGKAI